MIEESQQAMHYIYLFIFPSLCSYYLTGMIKELGLRLLVVLRLNLDTLKLVRKNRYNNEPVSTPTWKN